MVSFDCPARPDTDSSTGPVITNPLYADPNDCQFFYVCINNEEPRRNGCTTGLVFNDAVRKMVNAFESRAVQVYGKGVQSRD